MPDDNILPFHPIRHSHSHQFVSPDGRYWQANAYLKADALDRLVHGRRYTLPELRRLGLPSHGLHVRTGDEPPASVVYLKEKLPSAGGE